MPERIVRRKIIVAPHDSTEQARQVVALMPILRRWVTERVQKAGAARELSLRQYAALKSIREGATTPGDIARLWQVTPAVITGVIDRLERRELVRREIDPLDRRRFQLALTAQGEAASEEVERALIGALANQLASASPVDLAELERSLALLRRTFAALEGCADSTDPPHEEHDMPVWSEEEQPRPHDELTAARQTLFGARA